MSDFKMLYNSDLARFEGGGSPFLRKFYYFFRKSACTKNPILRLYYRWRFKLLKEKRGLEIYYGTDIGPGLYLGHVYNITINAACVIGKNCNIHKGVTIGQENRGRRKGTPVIGDCVWIGVNATVVGKIHIGNDVLIAPNSYVNCDVPDHSIVFGNPCVIKHRDNATEDYINNKI